MKFLSLDIETTGLDRDLDQVIEFGAIIEDTNNQLSFEEIPKFHAIIKHERYSGSEFAINMNQRIFKILADRVLIRNEEEKIQYDLKHNICSVHELARDFYNWAYRELKTGVGYNEPIVATVAGKNYSGFDGQFLSRIPEWNDLFRFKHRALDPAVLYWNPTLDTELPSLDECLKRAGIDDFVSHNAVEDAMQIIKVLRKKY